MGSIVIVRALSDGYVDIAGPSYNKQVKIVVELMEKFGSEISIVDGALGRKSTAISDVSEATILSTGAALSLDMLKVVEETQKTVYFLRLKESISLSDELLNRVLQIVEDGIKTQLKEKETLGKVFIDEDYKNIMLTTSEKDSNVSLRPMTRGSRIKFNPNAEVLRFFVAWKNLDEKTLKELNTAYSKLDEKTLKELTPMYSRVDVDLSALTFNENLEFNECKGQKTPRAAFPNR